MKYSSIIETIGLNAIKTPSRAAYTFLSNGEDREEILTYADLAKVVGQQASWLGKRFAKGARIILVFQQGLDFVKTFYSCLGAGIVAVPVPAPRAGENNERFQVIINSCNADGIIADRIFVHRLRNMLSPSWAGKLIAADEITDEAGAEGWYEVKESDIALLQYTSGSTSAPRGVVITHGNIFQNQLAIQSAFRQTEDSVVMSWLPFYHDMGLMGGIVQPLFSGARSILMSPVHFLQKPARWLSAISKYKVTTSGAPNFAYELCVDKVDVSTLGAASLSSWTNAFCGAEIIRPSTIRRFAETFGSAGFRESSFQSCYGMAEATLLVSASTHNKRPNTRTFTEDRLSFGNTNRFSSSSRSISFVGCGQPVNTEVVIINNDNQEVDPGYTGEICICGPGVSCGIWHADKIAFDTEDYYQYGNKRYFKTGDLGLFHDGELFITGRKKEIIIINGRNYFPTDIESHVMSAVPRATINRCVAFSIPGELSESLVIVLEAKKASTINSLLIKHIRETIFQEFELNMQGIVVVKSGEIPLTSSGKVQRLLCRKKFLHHELHTVEHSNAPVMNENVPGLAVTIAQIIDPNYSANGKSALDSFYSMGLNSIGFIQLAPNLSLQLGKHINAEIIFEYNSPLKLANAILEGKAGDLNDWEVTGASAQLSGFQSGLWFDEQLRDTGSSYLMPVAIELAEEICSDTIQSAIDTLIQNHEILRTRFVVFDGQPQRVVEHSSKINVSVERNESIGTLISRQTSMPFNLQQAPLLRAIICEGEKGKTLLLVFHHLVADGFSINLFIKEFNGLIKGHPAGGKPVTYSEFVQFERSRSSKSSIDHLLKILNNDPGIFQLPFDFPPTRSVSRKSSSLKIQFDSRTMQRVINIAAREECSVFTIVFAAFCIALHRFSGAPGLWMMSPISTRADRFTNVMGPCLNIYPLRILIETNDSMRDILAKAKQCLSDAFHNRFVSMTGLDGIADFERDHNNRILSSVFINGLNFIEGETTAALDAFRNNGFTDMQMDINAYIVENADGIAARVDYRHDLFKEETMQWLLYKWQEAIDAIGTDVDLKIAHRPFAPIAHSDVQDVIAPPNGINPFEKIFNSNANRIAISYSDRQVTYERLNEESNRIARVLQASPSKIVILLLSPSIHIPVAIIAVIKAGKTFVPLDPKFPKARLISIIKQFESFQVLTDDINIESANSFGGNDPLNLDNRSFFEAIEKSNVETVVDSSTPAYILFTSGSTGLPKGVVQASRSLFHFMNEYSKALSIVAEDHLTGFFSYTSDSFFNDLFGALLNGACYCGLNFSEVNFDELQTWLEQKEISVWHSTPSMFRTYLRAKEPSALNSLRIVKMAGEPVTIYDFFDFKKITAASASFVVSYGSTECSLAAISLYRHDSEATLYRLPVSPCIRGVEIKVLNGSQNECDVMEVGEVFIQSEFLFQHYWKSVNSHNSRLTVNGVEYYRTNDYGRRLPSGMIEVIGRTDTTLKLRGNRVDIADVESAIVSIDAVQDACVFVLNENDNREKSLVAVIELKMSRSRSEDEIFRILFETLPSYMLPSRLIIVDRIPVTVSGKRDLVKMRKQLEEASGENSTGLKTEMQEKLQSLLFDILPGIQFIPNRNFFQQGLNSLSVLRLVNRIEGKLGYVVTLKDVFENPTIERLSNKLEGKRSTFERIQPVADANDYPLSPSQRRVWLLCRATQAKQAYQIVNVCEITGNIDPQRLEAAFRKVIQRYEILRTNFVEIDGECRQVVRDNASSFSLPVRNSGTAFEEIQSDFELSSGLLIRATLFSKDDRNHQLLLVTHHLISDGWSNNLLARVTSSIYAGIEPVDVPALQYRDTVTWQLKRLNTQHSRLSRFWLNYLRGAPYLRLIPRGYNRQEDWSAGQLTSLHLSYPDIMQFRTSPDGKVYTDSTIIIALIHVALYRITGSNDMLLGLINAGRNHSDLEMQLGFFSATVPLRTKCDPSGTFFHLLEILTESMVAVTSHSEYPLDRIIEDLEDSGNAIKPSIFDVAIACQDNSSVESDIVLENDVRIKLSGIEPRYAIFDLMFDVRLLREDVRIDMIFRRSKYNVEDIRNLRDLLSACWTNLRGAPGKSMTHIGDPEKQFQAAPETASNYFHVEF